VKARGCRESPRGSRRWGGFLVGERDMDMVKRLADSIAEEVKRSLT